MPRRVDVVDVAVREPTGLVREPRGSRRWHRVDAVDVAVGVVAATVSTRCRDAVVVITRESTRASRMDVIVSLNAGAENEAVEQVAFADRILLNKIDLATEPELVAVEQRLKGINAFAPIIRSEKSQVSVDQVLGIKAFDLKKTLEMDPEFLDTEGEHEHDDSVTSMSITTSGEVHMLLVNDWVGDVLKNLGNDIYRMKGVLAVAGSPKKFVYQAVHMIFDGVFEGEWGPNEPRGNKLVFIGKNLDKQSLQRGFEACLDTPQNRAKIEEAEMIKVFERQQNALLGAAQRDDVVAIKNILQSGAAVSYANSVGQTALHIATLWGNASAVEALVQAGAAVDQVNDLGAQTPLHLLASRVEAIEHCEPNPLRQDAHKSGLRPWQEERGRRHGLPVPQRGRR